jgi:hypothetical protein
VRARTFSRFFHVDLTIRTFCRHQFGVRTDMFMLCLLLDKMLEET